MSLEIWRFRMLKGGIVRVHFLKSLHRADSINLLASIEAVYKKGGYLHMAFKKNREMKVYGSTGTGNITVPQIRLQGKWLQELGFDI